MAQVVLDRVTKIYPGNVVAVEGLNLTIADHEFIVLVGPTADLREGTSRLVIKPASKGHLAADMSRVHFFEPGEFGRNLSLPPK